jgi:hypothetical protein
LHAQNAAGSICDVPFHQRTVTAVARSLQESLASARPFDGIGVGQAPVDRVASNRRYVRPDGKISFGRMSATRDPQAQAAPEGTVDPFLKTLSFWNGDLPVAAIHAYATHPMSYYGRGGVSGDFVALARRRRQDDDTNIFQIYVSGCSGNVTAGRYNDGSPANRPALADRLYNAMVSAWTGSERRPVQRCDFRNIPFRLEPRGAPGFTPVELERRLRTDPKPFGQCLAALGLSWRKRTDAGLSLDLPIIDFGFACLLLLPAESYVEFQLFAQQQRPNAFVMSLGYGECGPGYIPIDQAWAEEDSNLGDWCWVAPGAEAVLKKAITQALAIP